MALAADFPRSVPAILRLIAVLLFLPEESSFTVFDLRLTAIRCVFLVLAPILVVRVVQKAKAGGYRLVLSDAFVFLTAVWVIAGPSNVVGLSEALKHGGPLALEFLVGYMATRTLLSERGQALSFINLVCLVISVVALLGFGDTLTGRFFLRGVVSQFTGYSKGFTEANYDVITRMGMLRAASTLEHPIALGVVCMLGFLFSVVLPLRMRRLIMAACVFGAVISISSAPIQAGILGLCLLLYNRMTSPWPYRWLALMAVGAAGLSALFTFVDRPFGFIFRHFTFDPSTAYFRLWTWNVAGDALGQSPWFGLGYGPWTEDLGLPYTIDSVWLHSALQFGIPGAALIGLSFLGSVSLPTSGHRVALTADESRLGMILGIMIFLIIYLGFTVDFWGIDWILISLLIGVRAHLGERGRLAES